MRTLFFGTPAFAVPSLDALAATTEVVGVVCQPDRPVGRGLVTGKPPVTERAEALGLTVVQPSKLRTGEFARWVTDQRVDLAVVVAYGRILPPDVLAATRLGFVNVHASLLPRYRGAAPITWAVVRGEVESGVTLMLLDEGMDTGDMLAVERTAIGANETAGQLGERLALLGAKMVGAQLAPFARGELARVPQDHSQATLAPLLAKQDGLIDWSMAASGVHDHVRGMSPWPGAFTRLRDKTVKVLESRRTYLAPPHRAAAGTVVVADKSRVLVSCGGSTGETVEVARIQLEGKKPVTAGDWVSGRGVREGDVFGADT